MTPEDRARRLEMVRRWQSRYPRAVLRDLGFNLLDVAAAAASAELHLERAAGAPGLAREAECADAAWARLFECIQRFNAEVHQLREGVWPV